MSKKLLAMAVLPFAALAQDPSVTEEVTVVTANRVEQVVSSVLAPISIISREDIELSMAKSVPEILRMVPGIDIGQTGGRGSVSSVFMRGTESDHVLVLIDGVRLPSSITSAVDFSKIPVSQIENIEIIRGPRGALYGSDAIGGVINIITRGKQGDDIKQISAGIGSDKYYQGDAFLSLDITERTHLNLGLGYDDSEGYNVYPVAGKNDGDKHGYNNKNALLGLDHNFNDKLSAFIISRYSQNTSEYHSTFPKQLKKEQRLETTSVVTGAKYKRNLFASALTYSFGESKAYHYEVGDDYNNADSTLFTTQHNLSVINSLSLSDSLLLNVGLDWRDDQVEDEGGKLTDKVSRYNTGVFTTGVYEVASVTFDGSVRYDDNEAYGGYTTWGLAAGWEFVKDYSVILSTGTSFKAPSMYDLYGVSAWTVGNPDLKPETGESIEVGVKGITSAVNWRLTVYQNKIEDLIDSECIANDPLYGCVKYKMFNNDGISKIQGIELEANVTTGIVDHQAVLEYLDPKDANGDTLLRRAKYKAKWQGMVTLGDADFSLRYLYQGERDDYVGFNKETISGYSLWDISAAYHVTDEFKVSARIDNLLDKEYATAQGYPAPERGYFVNVSYEF